MSLISAATKFVPQSIARPASKKQKPDAAEQATHKALQGFDPRSKQSTEKTANKIVDFVKNTSISTNQLKTVLNKALEAQQSDINASEYKSDSQKQEAQANFQRVSEAAFKALTNKQDTFSALAKTAQESSPGLPAKLARLDEEQLNLAINELNGQEIASFTKTEPKNIEEKKISFGEQYTLITEILASAKNSDSFSTDLNNNLAKNSDKFSKEFIKGMRAELADNKLDIGLYSHTGSDNKGELLKSLGYQHIGEVNFEDAKTTNNAEINQAADELVFKEGGFFHGQSEEFTVELSKGAQAFVVGGEQGLNEFITKDSKLKDASENDKMIFKNASIAKGANTKLDKLLIKNSQDLVSGSTGADGDSDSLGKVIGAVAVIAIASKIFGNQAGLLIGGLGSMGLLKELMQGIELETGLETKQKPPAAA
jgi:hypothetical protein